MKHTKINSAFLSHIGFFRYDKKVLKKKKWKTKYAPSAFFGNSQTYLDQKYYTNWLHSMFQCFNGSPNHFQLKATSIQAINQSLSASEKEQVFAIQHIEVLLLPQGFGLFIIKSGLDKKHLQWHTIAETANAIRQIMPTDNIIPMSVQWIEDYITPLFCTNTQDWRKYNSQLKTVTLVDIDTQPTAADMDYYLLALGNHLSPLETDIFAASTQYSSQIITEASISVFHNWKALCLQDSLSRIAVNLNDKDQFKLWENEYLYLYVNVLFNRFFLQYTNDKLVDFTKKIKTLLKARDLFFVLTSKYNHHKVSYKFLPNTLYSTFSKAMDIQSEIDMIDNKIERLNTINQEKNNKRIQKLLAILAVLSTFFAVAKDGRYIFNIQSENLMYFLGGVASLAIVFLVFIFIGKKPNNL